MTASRYLYMMLWGGEGVLTSNMTVAGHRAPNGYIHFSYSIRREHLVPSVYRVWSVWGNGGVREEGVDYWGVGTCYAGGYSMSGLGSSVYCASRAGGCRHVLRL